MALRRRTERRLTAREQEKLTRDLERLALLEPGGAPNHPILVTSPSEVELEARSRRCPICRGELRVDEHIADSFNGLRLRVAKVVCVACGRRRSVYFQLRATIAN